MGSTMHIEFMYYICVCVCVRVLYFVVGNTRQRYYNSKKSRKKIVGYHTHITLNIIHVIPIPIEFDLAQLIDQNKALFLENNTEKKCYEYKMHKERKKDDKMIHKETNSKNKT